MKSIGLVLIAAFLSLILSAGSKKDFAVLLATGACCMVCLAAMEYLKPVVTFFQRLQAQGNWNGELFSILLKAVGIGILGEIASLLCSDTGNAALGKTITVLSSAVILWMSLPLFSSLLNTISEILGEL